MNAPSRPVYNFPMLSTHPTNPLEGITLEKMLFALHEKLGWEEMGRQIPIRCFTHDPSIKSSLAFLRKTPWAKTRVEVMYKWELLGKK